MKSLTGLEEYGMARNNFGGFGGGPNMQQLMRQAQKLQEQMEKAQSEHDGREYEAASGGGMVKVKVNGKRELLSIELNPQVVDPEDVEMLQDLILAAVNEALRKGEETREAEMNRLNPGMGGMF
jgi:DNA-binding YbaB/EbfC family protein